MSVNKVISVLENVFKPIETMCENFLGNGAEETSEEWFQKFKISLANTWENIYNKLMSYNYSQLDNYLQISNSIMGFFNLNAQTKLTSYNVYKKFLSKHYLVKTCLSLLILECFENQTFQCSNEYKKKYLDELIAEKSEELKKSVGLNTILLCVNQIEICFTFLIEMLYQEFMADVILSDTRRYVIQRLQYCLKFITQSHMDDNIFCNQPDSGSFMDIMDSALDLLTKIDVNQPKDETLVSYKLAKETVDELLCHSMSIAQIALSDDTIIVKAGCQKVLNDCEDLHKQLENMSNISMVNLMIESVSEALCALEQKVNVAVLKLLLEVYKDFDRYLQNLLKTCKETNTLRSADDLDELIIPFDLQVDRIMQIGYFAVACSTHKQRVLQMRSALASLESLESELVPAITTYYMDQSIESEKQAVILANHWSQMVNILQDLIHLIVDPIAFTQIVLDSCTEAIEKLQTEIKNEKNFVLNIEDFISVCNEGDLLMRHLKICIPEAYSIQPEELLQFKKIYSNILHECKASLKILLIENNAEIVESAKRVLKRLKILVSYMKKIWNELVISNETDKENASFNNSKYKSTIITKKKIDELIEANQIEKQSSITTRNMAILMMRGEILRKERSILYQTPKKVLLKDKIALMMPTPTRSVSKTPKSVFKRELSSNFARRLDNLSMELSDHENHVDVTEFLEQLADER